MLLITEVIGNLASQADSKTRLVSCCRSPPCPVSCSPSDGPLHQQCDQLLVGHGRRLPRLGTLYRLHGLQLHDGVSHLTSLP